MKRYSLTLLIHILVSYCCLAQDSSKHHSVLFDMFIAAHPVDTGSGSEKVFLVPVYGHSPEAGNEYGGAIFKNFYLPTNKQFRSSYVTAKGSYTSRHALNFIGYGEFWSHKNSFFWDIDVRHQEFPFYFYGIGNDTKLKNKTLMEEKLSHVNVEGAKEIWKHFYTGVNILIEKQKFQLKDTILTPSRVVLPNEKFGTYANIGLIEIYDSRDNIQYTTNGLYGYFKASFFPKIKKENDFTGTQLNFNFRAFTTPIDRLTFGYNMVYNQFNSKIAPFYLLPQLGNDQIMRGFYAGRFRDKKLFAHQIELRYHFIERMAVTGFIGMGETTPKDWALAQFRRSWGGGFRYFFDVKQRSTIRFDYAMTQRLPGEKRQTGIYIILGEAF